MRFHMNCNTMGLEDRETILQQLSQRVSGFLNHKLFETNITIDIVTLISLNELLVSLRR